MSEQPVEPASEPEPGAAPKAKGSGLGIKLGVVGCMFMGSTCCLLLGLGGGASGGDLSKQVKALGGASVVKVADAANASGVVCVEATVPEVVGPVVVPGTQIKCLYYQETIKTTEKKTRRGRKFRKRTSTSTDTERTSVYAA